MPIPYYVGKVDAFDPKLKLQNLNEGLASRIKTFRRTVSRSWGCSFYDIMDGVEWNVTLSRLINYHPEYTDLWFKPERIDVYQHSELLTSARMTNFFEYWWDPNEFDWDTCNSRLIENMGMWFTHWWDPTRFEPIEDYVYSLTRNCERYFNVWWPGTYIFDKIKEKKKHTFTSVVHDLCYWRITDFDTWWRSDAIFDNPYVYTNQYCSILSRYYENRFHDWWNPELFQWQHFDKQKFDDMLYLLPLWWDGNKVPDRFWNEHSITLCEKANWCFDVWWDPEKFNYGKNQSRKDYSSNSTYYLFGRDYLMKYCSEHIDKWYNKVKIRANKKNIKLLKQHCQSGHSYWGPDFVTMQLADELSNEEEDSD